MGALPPRTGKGGVYTELLLPSPPCPRLHTSLVLANVYHSPHPVLSGASGLTGEWRPNQTGNGGPMVSPHQPQHRIQTPDQRLETSGLYCKIIQTPPSSSCFSTLQSMSQDQGPTRQSLLHKVTLPKECGHSWAHISFPSEARRWNSAHPKASAAFGDGKSFSFNAPHLWERRGGAD